MSQLLNGRTHSVINHNLGAGSACPPASAAASAAGQRKQGHSEVTQASCVCWEGRRATHMVLGALIDGLNIALHLQDLGHSRTCQNHRRLQ